MRKNAHHKRRAFTPAEDAVILSWCKGNIGLFECIKKINSSVPTVKARASELCAGELNLDVPHHKPNKNYTYNGADGEPLDVSNFSLTVGNDKLLNRLQRGLR